MKTRRTDKTVPGTRAADAAGPCNFRFLDFELSPALRRLSRRGRPLALGARAFDLLLCLIENRARVVTRDEIMTRVWEGAVVGDNNLNVQVATLRRLICPEAVVTVPRRGLRFGLEVERILARPVRPPPTSFDPSTSPPLPDKPSVAVLPFLSLGGESDADWFADSVAEDITTELSRFHELFVIARNSAFTFRGRATEVREISRVLGVRYVVEGSVRHGGSRLRVSAQLIDALGGAHVWAEKFECAAEEQFLMQDDVSRAIAAAVAPQIRGVEDFRARRVSPKDLDAHGLAQRAWATVWPQQTCYDPAPREKARALVQEALEIDPECVLALRTLSLVLYWDAYHNTNASVSDALVEGIDAAGRAIAIDGGDHHAWRQRGQLHGLAGRPERGLADLRRAVEINPNCATSLGWLSMYEAFDGDARRAVGLADEAVRLSPLDPARSTLLVLLAFTRFAVRDYATSLAAAERAMHEAPETATPYLVATIGLVALGRLSEARSTFERLYDLAPNLAEARLAGRWLSTNEDYQRRAHAFLRVAAGREEPAAAEALR